MSILEAQKQNPPTEKNLRLANSILGKLGLYSRDPVSRDKIYSYALEWRDVDIWKRVANKYLDSQPISEAISAKLASAVQQLGFSALQTLYGRFIPL